MSEYFNFQSNGKNYRLHISKIYESTQLIRYQVRGKNKSLIFQNNEPLLRTLGLRHRRPDWKLIEGQIHDPGFLTNLILYLDRLQKKEKI